MSLLVILLIGAAIGYFWKRTIGAALLGAVAAYIVALLLDIGPFSSSITNILSPSQKDRAGADFQS